MREEIILDKDVCKEAVLCFLDDCRSTGMDIHTLAVYKDGVPKIRIAIPPYSCVQKAQLYSLSKSFCSTAIGLLVDEGVITVEDRVVDIFSEKLPENISPELSEMRIKHLLSMNTGHESCILGCIMVSDDPVKGFLQQEVKYRPGSHFVYNNAATYMLSEIVTKYTGRTAFDFLQEKVFIPLEIEDTVWNRFQRCSQGAMGFHASIDDISKLGLLYLNKGVWNGQRILSEEWVREASRQHSDNSGNETPDWTSGYGYQFWMNAKGGFRADGAFGQLCMIFPDDGMVIAMQACVGDMQAEVNKVYELKDSFLGKSQLSMEDFQAKIHSYNQPDFSNVLDEKYLGRNYRFSENPLGITGIYFSLEGENVVLHFSDGESSQRIVCGNHCFHENKIHIKGLKPTLLASSRINEVCPVHFAASYQYEEAVLSIQIRYLDNPHSETVTCRFTENRLDITFDIDKSLIIPGAGHIASV